MVSQISPEVRDDPKSAGLLPLLAAQVTGHHAPVSPKKDNSVPLVIAVDASQLVWQLAFLNFPDNFWWNVGYSPGLQEEKYYPVEESNESCPY